jgi:electron transport complex protein RnfB
MRPLAEVLPIVGDLASNDDERRARDLKRNRARRRFEQRNARLQREEACKLA